MAALLQVFHDVAYKARDRNDLLSGIDEFLDQVTVLPPGEWDPSIRIDPPKSVPSQVKDQNRTRHASSDLSEVTSPPPSVSAGEEKDSVLPQWLRPQL